MPCPPPGLPPSVLTHTWHRTPEVANIFLYKIETERNGIEQNKTEQQEKEHNWYFKETERTGKLWFETEWNETEHQRFFKKTKRNETERHEIEPNETEHSWDYAETEWNEMDSFETEKNETEHKRNQRQTERTGKNRKLYLPSPFRSVSFRSIPFRAGIKKCCPPLVSILIRKFF